MKMFKFFLLLGFVIFIQACSSFSSKRQDTGNPSILDGAWIKTKCTCTNKDALPSDTQEAHTLFINGNLVFQDQLVRWKKPEWNRYCSIHEEATITSSAHDIFEVTTVSERTISPRETQCNVYSGKSKRTWKILVISKSELKYESTNGCDTGPMICAFKRLDQ